MSVAQLDKVTQNVLHCLGYLCPPRVEQDSTICEYPEGLFVESHSLIENKTLNCHSCLDSLTKASVLGFTWQPISEGSENPGILSGEFSDTATTSASRTPSLVRPVAGLTPPALQLTDRGDLNCIRARTKPHQGGLVQGQNQCLDLKSITSISFSSVAI